MRKIILQSNQRSFLIGCLNILTLCQIKVRLINLGTYLNLVINMYVPEANLLASYLESIPWDPNT